MTVQEKLAQPLARERVRTRTDGRGGSLAYLETHDVIRTANEIFGPGGWGHEVRELRFIGQSHVKSKEGKEGVSVGYICIVRVHAQGLEETSGVGFGDATEYRDSGPVTAHELAAKEAESDALKRALKNYGDQFGLALYDKDSARSEHITSQPAEKAKVEKARPAAQPIVPSLETLQDRLLEIIAQADLDVPQWREKIAAQTQRPDFKGWLERQIAAGESSLALRAEQEQADREAAVETPAFVAPTGKRGQKAAA